MFAFGRPKQPGGGHGGGAGGHESVTQRWRQQKRQCMASFHIYMLHVVLGYLAFITHLCFSNVSVYVQLTTLSFCFAPNLHAPVGSGGPENEVLG